jgi:hypothetical protein
MEIQNEKSLPFLDVLISRQSDDTHTHQVYRKKTYTDIFLHAHSHYHPIQKYVILKTMVARAIRIFAPHFLEKEKFHLTKALMAIGYSNSQINKGFHLAHHSKYKNSSSYSPPLALISLLYIQGTTYQISKKLAKKNIKTLFKPYKTLKRLS